MPFFQSNYSSDESEIDAVIIDRSPEVRSRSPTRPRREGLTFGFKFSDLFRSRSRRRKVVRIIEEAPVRSPVHRREQHYSREVRFRDESPSPPPMLRRAQMARLMTEGGLADGFTPLPPKIKKSSSQDSDDDRSFIIENRKPKRESSKSSKTRSKSSHKRNDSKLDREPEFIEVPSSSPRRLVRESDAQRALRKQAERDAARERELRAESDLLAAQNADALYQERKRREEVESLGRQFEQAFIEEHDGRRGAVREAEAAKARVDTLAKQLEREKRDKRYLERKAEILAREKRVAEEERLQGPGLRPILRPVSLHQDPLPTVMRDPGAEAIRRAQDDARRRQQDDALYESQRKKGRRGSLAIFDDDTGRRGHRRQ